jgi:hypothetical protein
MKSAEAKRDYPDPERRAAVAHNWYRRECGGESKDTGQSGGGSKLKRVRAG